MADGTMMTPADDTAAQPTPAPQPLIQRLWAKVLQAKRLGLYSPSDIDEYVSEHTGGKLSSVVDLTKALAQTGRATDLAEASKGPSAPATFMEGLADQAGLGIASKLNLGGAGEMMEAGRAEHPYAALGGEMAGAAGPSTIGG